MFDFQEVSTDILDIFKVSFGDKLSLLNNKKKVFMTIHGECYPG